MEIIHGRSLLNFRPLKFHTVRLVRRDVRLPLQLLRDRPEVRRRSVSRLFKHHWNLEHLGRGISVLLGI